MKKRLSNLRNLSTTYELFIGIGLLMVISTLLKLLGFIKISSDWFWFIVGLGLIVEGTILLAKQKKFDKKYKIVLREQE